MLLKVVQHVKVAHFFFVIIQINNKIGMTDIARLSMFFSLAESSYSVFKQTNFISNYYYYVNSIFCTDYLSGEIIVGMKKKLSIYFFSVFIILIN